MGMYPHYESFCLKPLCGRDVSESILLSEREVFYWFPRKVCGGWAWLRWGTERKYEMWGFDMGERWRETVRW